MGPGDGRAQALVGKRVRQPAVQAGELGDAPVTSR
jgi:hypothetical protein